MQIGNLNDSNLVVYLQTAHAIERLSEIPVSDITAPDHGKRNRNAGKNQTDQQAENYFEIFMGRMLLCCKAAEKLGLKFKLMINNQPLI